MKAGRELDALVAEKVMGWRCEQRKRWAAQDPQPFYVHVWVTLGGREYDSHLLPHYSTDIAAAWEIVSHFVAKQVAVRLFYDDIDKNWRCEIAGSEATAACAATVICLAALKAASK